MVDPRRPRALTARQQIPGMVQESAWQTTMEQALTRTGWTWIHVGRAMVPQRGAEGRGKWLTPATKGFPDLLALRGGHLLVVELKKDGEYPKPAQRVWLELFHLVPGALVWVSRPSDPWPDLTRWLQRPGEAPRLWGWEPAAVKAARLAERRRPRPTKRSTPGSNGGKPDTLL